MSEGEWWRNVFTKYGCYIGNVEIQGIPTKSGEVVAKSDIDRRKREVCNNEVVCFTDLKMANALLFSKKLSISSLINMSLFLPSVR